MSAYDRAMVSAIEYRRHCALGDVVLAGEVRRTIDDLVGHPTGDDRRCTYPRPVAEAMGLHHLADERQ